ncbi:MAG: type I methionyl aminopeptidase [Chloroflexi bacterium]|jgi:methionyl aminopeptidase|nr:type I methionyl aminopeptidase [Chloroflexota bacterium]MBT3669336.1 type I methionyl aminopeptidase [Chloroflexota bacterium]MBT4306043.1 type I methionyl aminopeptidase [Chloroflexota bacterium]MBT4532687.1 type I methionyl aminopeptidase [Chloroflexota bacterium]MBT4684143.1 type I methionyl aminopeptidase [Chloroflexota bacterium]
MAWERNVVIKSQPEIEIMQAAGRINALALKAVREAIRPGVSTAVLDKIAETVIRDHEAIPAFLGYPGPTPYPGTINACLNEEMVHGLPSARTVKEGDLVSIDCGTIYQGFVADSAFSVGVGEVSKEVKQLLEVTEKSLEIGISKMLAGNRVGDVSAAIQEYVESFGYHVPREYTGHGVGRTMHEGPQVPNYGLPGRGMVLRPGLTIALEPMVLVGTPRTKVLSDQWTVVSIDGSHTAHYEHSVAVTEGKPLILTQV